MPDYEGTVRDLIARHPGPGGHLVSFQDPLWHLRVPRATRALDLALYLPWRLRRGNLLHGFKSRIRWWRKHYDDENPSDLVEYHVVRQGVDEAALLALLEPCFDEVELVTYWSSHTREGQRIGEAVGVRNLFGIVARGYRPSRPPPAPAVT